MLFWGQGELWKPSGHFRTQAAKKRCCFDLNNKYLNKGLVSKKPGEPSLPFARVFPRRNSRTWETPLLPPLPKWLPRVPFSCPPVSQGQTHTASQTSYHPIFQKNLTKMVCRVRSTGEETGAWTRKSPAKSLMDSKWGVGLEATWVKLHYPRPLQKTVSHSCLP